MSRRSNRLVLSHPESRLQIL